MSNESKELSVRIADIVVRARSDDMALALRRHYRAFSVNGIKPDIDVRIRPLVLPNELPEEKLFDSGGPWNLYEWRGKYLFTFSSPTFAHGLYKVAIFDRCFRQGDIQIDYGPDYTGPCDPFSYPLDELLMVNYLAQGRGIDIHALGVVAPDSSGMAFVGVSGAGKSTTARLLMNTGAKVLCDDRIILRMRDKDFWLHSTPWHGDARVAIPGQAPLRRLFFLKQARDNRIVPLNCVDAAKRLLVCCFPTFHDSQGMEFTLDFVADLTQRIPCYEFQFTPDQRAVDMVLNYVEACRL